MFTVIYEVIHWLIEVSSCATLLQKDVQKCLHYNIFLMVANKRWQIISIAKCKLKKRTRNGGLFNESKLHYQDVMRPSIQPAIVSQLIIDRDWKCVIITQNEFRPATLFFLSLSGFLMICKSKPIDWCHYWNFMHFFVISRFFFITIRFFFVNDFYI